VTQAQAIWFQKKTFFLIDKPETRIAYAAMFVNGSGTN
jgi:hypothetical protein